MWTICFYLRKKQNLQSISIIYCKNKMSILNQYWLTSIKKYPISFCPTFLYVCPGIKLPGYTYIDAVFGVRIINIQTVKNIGNKRVEYEKIVCKNLFTSHSYISIWPSIGSKVPFILQFLAIIFWIVQNIPFWTKFNRYEE